MSISHLGDAVLQRDRADLADLDAGDADRLALTGGEGLAAGHVGVHLHRRGLDEREPQPLVVEDVAGDDDRQQQQHEDRDEIGGVGFDRALHWSSWPVALRGRAWSLWRRARGRAEPGEDAWRPTLPSDAAVARAPPAASVSVGVGQVRDRRLGLARHVLHQRGRLCPAEASGWTPPSGATACPKTCGESE